MVTLITLVLTVMTLAVQLAMEQFSARIVQALLRDRGNQISMGLFGGAAVHDGLIDLVSGHFRSEVDRCPSLPGGPPPPPPADVVLSAGHGVIVAIDTDRLVRLAEHGDTAARAGTYPP